MAHNQIKGGYPLKVEEIVFEDGSSITDKVILFCGNFVVVDDDEGAPTMYNVRTIAKLRKVEELRPQYKSVIW